jgi:hypothetical protein
MILLIFMQFLTDFLAGQRFTDQTLSEWFALWSQSYWHTIVFDLSYIMEKGFLVRVMFQLSSWQFYTEGF